MQTIIASPPWNLDLALIPDPSCQKTKVGPSVVGKKSFSLIIQGNNIFSILTNKCKLVKTNMPGFGNIF